LLKGTLNQKLEDPKYRAEFEHRRRAFNLEVQILLALEDKGWGRKDLERVIAYVKGNKLA